MSEPAQEVPQPGTPAGKHRVAIVDGHPVILHGLAHLVNQEPDLETCAQVEDHDQALAVIASSRPAIVLVNISEKDVSNGVELIKAVHAQHPQLPILVLSMQSESFYAELALRAGAKGYVSLTEPVTQMLTAVRRALVSGVYVSEKLAVDIVSRLVSNGRPGRDGLMLYGLTDREYEVFECIGKGMTVRQIAEKLHRSTKTVEAHREHIKKKLKLENTTELVRRAIHWVEYRRTAS
ncbi:MAG: LuxR C-terminal-related transcriptional regulator [Phycisphaerae bacterium]